MLCPRQIAATSPRCASWRRFCAGAGSKCGSTKRSCTRGSPGRRARELRHLTRAWNNPKTHIVSIVAWGGVGKTALAVEWMSRFAERNWEGVDRYFDWSFYSQGTREQGAASADMFIATARSPPRSAGCSGGVTG